MGMFSLVGQMRYSGSPGQGCYSGGYRHRYDTHWDSVTILEWDDTILRTQGCTHMGVG